MKQIIFYLLFMEHMKTNTDSTPSILLLYWYILHYI